MKGHTAMTIPTTPAEPATLYKAVDAVLQTPIDPDAAYDVTCWMSTDRVDEDDEVLLPEGCDLSRFEKNAPVLLCHDWMKPVSYYPLPVGQVVWIKRRPKGLLGAIKFATGTQMGREVRALVLENVLKGVSVGAKPREQSPMTREEAASRPDWQAAYTARKGKINVVRRWSLWELSVTPLPCNEDTLIEVLKSKGMSRPAWVPRPKSPSPVKPESPPVPYELARRKKDGQHGWVVRNRDTGRAYSGEPLSHEDALAQLRAIEMHTHGKSAVPSKEPKGRDLIGIHKPPFADHPDDMEPWEEGEDTDEGAVVKDEADGDPDEGGDEGMEDMAGKAMPRPDDDDDADEEPDADEDDTPLRAGHFAEVTRGPHKGVKGKIKSVHRAGLVPDVAEDVPCSKSEPGVKLNVYKAMGEGWRESSHHVGVKMAHAVRCDELKPPKARKGVNPLTLPPLRGRTDDEVAAEKLRAVRKALTPEAVRAALKKQEEKALGAV